MKTPYLLNRHTWRKDETLHFVRIIFFLLIASLFSCSEREISYDKLQERNGIFYAMNEKDPYSGKVVAIKKDGRKLRELYVKNGKLHGLAIIYYDNGQRKKEGTYKAGKKDGQWAFWYDNGQKEREGAYKEGKEDGQWRFWYKSGQREKEGAYEDGKQEGIWNYWTRDGRKMGVVTDVDGNIYRTIKIGEQWWMTENLKVTQYRNGDSIPNVTDNLEWVNLTCGAYCNYNNDEVKVATYGRLYNWFAVSDSRNIAPEGWHVPSDEEWQTLVDYLGGLSVAGGKMKTTGTIEEGNGLWYPPNDGATNESGFSALPGGFRYDRSGLFSSLSRTATFWSATKTNIPDAWSRRLKYNFSGVYRHYYNKHVGYLVRCIKD